MTVLNCYYSCTLQHNSENDCKHKIFIKAKLIYGVDGGDEIIDPYYYYACTKLLSKKCNYRKKVVAKIVLN